VTKFPHAAAPFVVIGYVCLAARFARHRLRLIAIASRSGPASWETSQ
jgi:hypothetical protein